ncbi:hypothetical protein GCM10009682_01240 [Luedemannella flava]|uniref:Uncharacterized protein n=2 Tax=Luedemannella flava TaxID=349316 RepID=A0ABN2LBV0_9ACTN
MPGDSSMTYRRVGRILYEIGMVSGDGMRRVVDEFADVADDELSHYGAACALGSFGVAVSIHADDIDSIYEDYAHLLATAAQVAGDRVQVTNVRIVEGEGDFEDGRCDRLEFERDGAPVSIDAEHFADDYYDPIAASVAIRHTAADDDPRSWHNVRFDREPHRVYDDIMILATPDQAAALQEHLGFQLLPA